MPLRTEGCRRGFTLLELLVVIGIVGVVTALLLCAVVRVREAANRVKCSNNLRQVGVATAIIHEHRGELPRNWVGPPAQVTAVWGSGPVFYWLLPGLGETNVFNQGLPSFTRPGPGGNVGTVDQGPYAAGSALVRSFVCPADSSNASGTVVLADGLKWGVGNYGANWKVFSLSDRSPARHAALPQAVPDGLSNTIFFAEKLALSPGGHGGSFWAYPAFITPVVGSRFSTSESGNYAPLLGFPEGNNTFTVQPSGNSPVGMLDFFDAQSPHLGGINVCMGDGSVRFIGGSTNQDVWVSLLTPAGNDNLGSEGF